jgi:hypothetical protein
MLISDGGGGGTSWHSMSMEDMQRLIQNPDIEKHYDLVGGWRKSAELVNSHLFQVQSYHDNLTAVWPPDKSAAAEAYLGRLKELLANLTETHEAALANHDALAAATLSLSLAQGDVQKIYDEYAANQTLLQTFETQKQEKAAGPTPQPTLRPSGEEPPVAPGRQEELRQRAAVLLSGVSSDLAQAQMRLVRPKPFEPARGIEETKPNDGDIFVAPPIPPISSGFIRSETQGASGTNKPSATFPTSNNQPAPLGGPPSPPMSQQPGLVLGGTSLPVANPSTSGISAIPPTLPGTGNALVPNPSPLSTSPVLPPSATTIAPQPGGLGRGSTLPREGLIRPGSPSSLGGVPALPPGGMIGGSPGIGIGQPVAARPEPRRVNPIGGVIGERTPPSRGLGEPVGSYGTSYGQTGGRRVGRREGGEESHWDPDNPWETAEGVPPIVLPAHERRIDPGPAIGLN